MEHRWKDAVDSVGDTGRGALGVATEPAQAAAEEGVAPSPNYTPLGLPWQFLPVIV